LHNLYSESKNLTEAYRAMKTANPVGTRSDPKIGAAEKVDPSLLWFIGAQGR
jgi:hypothetical protein